MPNPLDKPNPYESPLVEPSPTKGTIAATGSPKRFRWQLIPATVIFCFGLLSFGITVIAVAANIDDIGQQPLDELSISQFLMFFTYQAFGVAWMTAGFLFWKGRLRLAVYATTVGVLIPVVAITIVAVTF